MKKFDRSFNGYNVEQVNSFVDDVISRVEDMITKMKNKDLEIDRLTKNLNIIRTWMQRLIELLLWQKKQQVNIKAIVLLNQI